MTAAEPVAPRFFAALDLAPAMTGATIDLPEGVAHHAVRVVRLAPGDALTLFTGRGGEYAATLTRVDKRSAAVRIERFDPVERESPLAVTLAQGVAANDAMDYAVRKAVELGVAAIQPLLSARSAPLPSGERVERRVAHWRQIAIAACEQCGRNRVPEIAPPCPLAEWLAGWTGRGFVLTPAAGASLASQPVPAAAVALLVGPEGGLDEREAGLAQTRGFVAVRIGPRVLRAETASVAALGAMQMLWGDLR
jgi:16S rRNA (uracil1498-N3)-methyltransferase